MTERSGKTGQVVLGVWFDEEAGDIHLSIPGHGLSTVNGNAESKRDNPHFTAHSVPRTLLRCKFQQLAKVLRDRASRARPWVES